VKASGGSAKSTLDPASVARRAGREIPGELETGECERAVRRPASCNGKTI